MCISVGVLQFSCVGPTISAVDSTPVCAVEQPAQLNIVNDLAEWPAAGRSVPGRTRFNAGENRLMSASVLVSALASFSVRGRQHWTDKQRLAQCCKSENGSSLYSFYVEKDTECGVVGAECNVVRG